MRMYSGAPIIRLSDILYPSESYRDGTEMFFEDKDQFFCKSCGRKCLRPVVQDPHQYGCVCIRLPVHYEIAEQHSLHRSESGEGGCGCDDESCKVKEWSKKSVKATTKIRVIVESVTGFSLLQELLGLAEQPPTQPNLINTGSENVDVIEVGSEVNKTSSETTGFCATSNFSSANPSAALLLTRLVKVVALLAQPEAPTIQCYRCHNLSASRPMECYSPVATCRNRSSGWLVSILAPVNNDVKLASELSVLDVEVLCVPTATMAPDMAWVRKLNSFNNTCAGLIKTNAVLSTIGGGRFLCRQVSHALELAKMQCAVASAMGDTSLAGKCVLNYAYGLVWLGRYEEATNLIRKQMEFARVSANQELLKLSFVALRFCHKVKRANCTMRLQRGVPSHLGRSGGDYPSTTRDNFHRIRAIAAIGI